MADVVFYVGVHDPHMAAFLPRVCLSIKRIARRKRSPIPGNEILVDSGAFSELALHGAYRDSSADYAEQLRRAHQLTPNIIVAVAQDYMCEPFMLAKTGLTIAEHQRLTIERYDELIQEPLPFPIMPVLQGYAPEDYQAHMRAYSERLSEGMWVGVGSVCKRNARPSEIVAVLSKIKALRPDLRLHGFGVKTTSLLDRDVRRMLFSADSMAWSFAARREGRDRNGWREAKAFADRIEMAGV
jgi:hypothetical protein